MVAGKKNAEIIRKNSAGKWIGNQSKRGNRGFTMIEMLVTTLILGLVSVMIATSIQSAFQVYIRSTQVSEAQVLCDTLATAIQDELRYATAIRVNTGGEIVFTSQSRGYGSGCMLGQEEGKIVILKSGNTYPLLPKSAYNNDLVSEVKCEISEDAEDVIQVTLTVKNREEIELVNRVFGVEPLNGME